MEGREPSRLGALLSYRIRLHYLRTCRKVWRTERKKEKRGEKKGGRKGGSSRSPFRSPLRDFAHAREEEKEERGKGGEGKEGELGKRRPNLFYPPRLGSLPILPRMRKGEGGGEKKKGKKGKKGGGEKEKGIFIPSAIRRFDPSRTRRGERREGGSEEER